MLDVGRHPNIELMAYSEVLDVSGEEGDFKVSVKRKARYVDEDKCTGCGACKEKCPTVLPDAFNEGLGTRKAIYSWFAQGIPSTHTIDPNHCRQLNGKKCGICAKVCQANAVNFDQKDRMVDLNVAAIIVATGYEVFDPSRIPEYNYKNIPNVITAIEFERLLSASGPTGGHLDRPSDLAVEAEIETLKKAHTKSLKQLNKLEEKFGESSRDFYQKFQNGEYADDKDRQNWAGKYEKHLTIEEPLLELERKAEGFETAKKLAFIQCVGSRDFRFYPSVRAIAACIPSRKPLLPRNMNRIPKPLFSVWTFGLWARDSRSTRFAAGVSRVSTMFAEGSLKSMRGPTTIRF